ncbi:MAG: glycosyltransferase, partial [Opitutaceae bacterium]
ADAFNAGIAAARGEWVWCLNGGDCVDARVIPERLFGMLTESRADVVIAGTTYEGESDPRPHPAETLRWPPLRSWIPHPSTLVRQRLFIQNGLFDERYTIAMDYEWWLRAIPTGAGVEVTNLPLAVFAPGGMSQRAENFPIVRREQRAAWRKHRVALGLSWTDLATRSLKASLAAFVEQRRKFHRVQ